MMDFPMVMLVYQELFTIKSGVRKSHGVFNLRFGKVTDPQLNEKCHGFAGKKTYILNSA